MPRVVFANTFRRWSSVALTALCLVIVREASAQRFENLSGIVCVLKQADGGEASGA